MGTAKKRNSEDSNWWFDRYQYDYRDYSYSVGSGSRSWMSKLGYYDDDNYLYSSKSRSTESVYQDLLNQLQNSANLIGNDPTNGRINVRWSNGANVNSHSDGTVFLSPDNLVEGGKIPEETVDAMTGKVYLASTLRETVDRGAFAAAYASRINHGGSAIHRGAVRLWESIETSIARDTVLEEWAGFSPYIATDAKRSSSSKEEVQEFVNASKDNPNLDAATLGIAWNLLNPMDKIKIPDCYDPCIDAAADALGQEVEAKDRFRTCFKIASKIASILPPQEEEEKNGEGEKSKGDTPIVCDSSLLGGDVGNAVDETLAEQIASSSDEDNDNSISVSTKDDELDQDGKDFVIMCEPPSESSKGDFMEVVRKYASQIRSIRSSLSFRNNDARLHSYGHRRGDIDENSLFKIKMNDDRLMCVRDEVTEKQISICLLVDESGSMGGERVRAARNVAVTLAEGLKGVNGITTSIYGHTAECERRGCTIREYYTPRNNRIESCMKMRGRSENHDGFAIMHTANSFYRDYGRSERKIMFVISDGQPAGSRYGGNSAKRHVKAVSDTCRKNLGIEVYGIGICDAYTDSTGESMYGSGNFVVLNNVESSLPTMTRFIRQVALKMKI
jgi:Mg-chelatase subunit ChlD